MSSTIGAISGSYETLAEMLAASSDATSNQLSKLEEQSASGYIAQTYGGLGEASQTVFDISPEVSQITAYQSNISAATSSMSVTQTAMTQIAAIAQDFYDDLPDLNNSNTNEVTTVASQAQSALAQVASLLNTTDGTGYVFSGEDSSNAPIADPNSITSSGMYTQISAAVADLSTLGASGVMSAAVSAASSNATGTTIFSAYLSSGSAQATSAEVGAGQTAQTGLLANQNTLAATTTGSGTTGSYMRDLMMSLSVLGSLNESQVTDTNFSGLVSSLQTTLSGVISSMGTEAGILGDTQTSITTQATDYTDLSTALTTQINNAQDVDLASVSTQLQSVQTQLTASYQLISGLKSLSLADYL